MFSSRLGPGLLATAVLLLACAAQSPPAQAPLSTAAPADQPGDQTVDPSDAQLADATATEAPPAASDQPAVSDEPEAPPRQPLASLCNEMCDAVAPKCTPLQLKGCRSTCDNYETHPPACDIVVRTALECARVDKDFLFCANVVPDSCAKQFKAINTCKETGKPPEDTMVKGMPAGWERYQGRGFSVIVPKGMRQTSKQGNKKWSVKSGDVVYEVALHPAPTATKLDNRAFLRAGNEIFGKCAPKLKLHALVEKPGHTSIQYHTTCPDGKTQVGRIHVVGKDMYILTAHEATSGTPEADAFVYSFEAE